MDAREIFKNAKQTVAFFEHPNGGWGTVAYFEDMGLYYANPMDSLRSGCMSKHFKTKGGAIRYMLRYGFTC